MNREIVETGYVTDANGDRWVTREVRETSE